MSARFTRRVLPKNPKNIVPVVGFLGIGLVTILWMPHPHSLRGRVAILLVALLMSWLMLIYDRAEGPSA